MLVIRPDTNHKLEACSLPIFEELLPDFIASCGLLLALHCDPDHVSSRICTLLHLYTSIPDSQEETETGQIPSTCIVCTPVKTCAPAASMRCGQLFMLEQ